MKLKCGWRKTKVMLVARHSWRFLPPPLLDGVQRVSSLLVLGVTLEDDLKVTEHVERTLEACSRSLYALRELRSHGLLTRALHQVARATTVAKLTYASPAGWRSHIGFWARSHWKVPFSDERNGLSLGWSWKCCSVGRVSWRPATAFHYCPGNPCASSPLSSCEHPEIWLKTESA